MANDNNICKEHSGCMTDIANIKLSDANQWTAIDKISDRIDSFSTRINITLGGVDVSCLLLAANLYFK